MTHKKLPFKLAPWQIDLLSLVIVVSVSLLVLVLVVQYRTTRIGLLGLGGIVGIVVGVGIFIRPQWGAYILAITIFTNMADVFTDLGLPSVNKPIVALTFISVVISRFVNRQTFKLKRTELLMMAYGLVLFISIFFARDRGTSLDGFIDFVKDFIIVLTLIYALQVRAYWRRTIWIIIAATTAIASLSILQTVTGSDFNEFYGFAYLSPQDGQLRVAGPVGDPNFYGQILNAVMVLALYRFLQDTRWWVKILSGVSTLILLFASLSTYSRGAFLAIAVVFVLILIERRVSLKKLLFGGLVLLILVPLSLPFLPPGFIDRVGTLSILTGDQNSVYEDLSFRGRTSEILSGIEMFKDSPLFGLGNGNYETNYQDYAANVGLEYRTEIRQAHSLYVETLAETGLFGILALGSVIVSLFVGFNKIRKQVKTYPPDPKWATWVASLQIAIISYLTTSIFLHGDYIRYLFFLIAMGITAVHISDRVWGEAEPVKTHQPSEMAMSMR